MALELITVARERAAREITSRRVRLLVDEPLLGNLAVRHAAATRRRRRTPGVRRELVAHAACLHDPDGAETLPDDVVGAERRRAGVVDVAGAVEPALDADETMLSWHDRDLLDRIGSLTR